MCLTVGCLQIFSTRDALEAHTLKNHSDGCVNENSAVIIRSDDTGIVEREEPDLRDLEETTSPVMTDSSHGFQSSGKSRQSKRTSSAFATSSLSLSSPLFSNLVCTFLRRGRSRGTAPLEQGHTEGGHTEEGHTEEGHTEEDHTEGGHTEGGHTEGRHTEEGHTGPEATQPGTDAPHSKPSTSSSVSPQNPIAVGRKRSRDARKSDNDRTSNTRQRNFEITKRVNYLECPDVAAKERKGKAVAEVLKSSSEYSDSESCDDCSESEAEEKPKSRRSKSAAVTEFVCPESACGRSFSKVRTFFTSCISSLLN